MKNIDIKIYSTDWCPSCDYAKRFFKENGLADHNRYDGDGNLYIKTRMELVKAMKEGLSKSDIQPESICLLKTRQESLGLLGLDGIVDLILVGDSLGTTLYGMNNTQGVTLKMMKDHGKAVIQNIR